MVAARERKREVSECVSESESRESRRKGREAAAAREPLHCLVTLLATIFYVAQSVSQSVSDGIKFSLLRIRRKEGRHIAFRVEVHADSKIGFDLSRVCRGSSRGDFDVRK